MLSTVIQNEIKGYKETPVEIVEGFFYNQPETIRRVYLYMNDSFTADVPDGSIFWNLGTHRTALVATNIDLDTKDLQTFGKGNTNFYQNWILKMKFQRWLRETGMGLTLDELSSGVASFGSAIWKKTKENGKTTIKQCDLRNLTFDPTVQNIQDSDFLIEIHYLTEAQLRSKKDVWDNVDKAIESAKRVETQTHKKSSL